MQTVDCGTAILLFFFKERFEIIKKFWKSKIFVVKYQFNPRDVIRRLCNKDRDQGQKGIGVSYRSCSDIQYIG